MEEKIKQIKENIEEILRNSEEHQNKKIEYILINSKTNETHTLASDGYDETIEFTPYTKNYENGCGNVPEWDFNYDYYVYNLLEEDFEIGYMSDELHYSIWCSLDELYPEDIDFKNGVEKYLKYCKEHNITKEYLDDKMKDEIPNADVPNIMKFYEKEDINKKLSKKNKSKER